MSPRPKFSILHPSARPDAWRKVYDDWLSKAAHPEHVEYVLCVDRRWGFVEPVGGLRSMDCYVTNNARRCYVDAVNRAAEAASGDMLIVVADDQFACDQWDDELLCDADGPEFVIEVSTGTVREHERGIM